jgi:hypothetical protein
MGTDSVSLLPLEPTAADAAAEQTVDWRRDGRRPDDLVYIAMHTVKPAISVWASPTTLPDKPLLFLAASSPVYIRSSRKHLWV